MKLFIIFLLSIVGITMGQDNTPKSSSSVAGESSSEQTYRVGDDVKAPRPVSCPDPKYPRKARKGHSEGSIVIWMIVGSDGRTRDAQVKRGISPELNQAAMDAAEECRFRPATKEGKPVAVSVSIRFDFKP